LKESRRTFAPPTVVPSDPLAAFGASAAFVCEFEKKIVGIIAWRNLGEEVEILDVVVNRVHRRQGHGLFLLKHLLQRSSEMSVQKIFLEVRESNLAAISLYKKLGFQIFGLRPNYYRNPQENALLMTLSLPA
jgi:ribosomal-protein-alanine N-acetyltransferase